jgi:hypothetical protein
MARHKNSAALFEVMNKNRANGSGVFSSIGSWFRPRPAGDAGVSTTRPALAQPESAEAPTPLAVVGSTAMPLAQNVRGGDVGIRLSYTSAIIGLFAIATVVGAAFLAGERMINPRPAIAKETTPEIRGGPVTPGVLNVNGHADYDPLADDLKTAGIAKPAEPVVRGPKRTIGLNYVIIQSYPKLDMATEAKKVLEEKGIESTIEQHLPGWGTNTSWYTVVGTWGFARNLSNSQEYSAYIKAIRDVSEKFGKKGSFKAFDPRPYKWGVKQK